MERLKHISRTTMIKLKCLECCDFEPTAVRGCTMTNCPLYAYRNGDTIYASSYLDNAVKGKCYECCGFDNEAMELCGKMDCPLWPFVHVRTKPISQSL